MADLYADHDTPQERILVLGEGRLIDVVRRVLDDCAADVIHLRAPNDRDIRRALTPDIDAVVVISRDDRVSLRLALVVEGVRPGVRLIVTIYNRDLAAQVRRAVRNVRVTSMAEIVAPALAGPCLGDGLVAVSRSPEPGGPPRGVRTAEDGPLLAPLSPRGRRLDDRARTNVASLLHPYELSAKTLLAGLLGFVAILLTEAIVVGLALHEPPMEALYLATRVIVTVGPNEAIEHGPGWLLPFSTVTMLSALAFTAIFTAGLINRLMAPRLVAILGRRTMPRRDQVVVVGLGQVGLRLCLMLRELGVPVVAVERDRQADNVVRAKRYGIPVVIGAGGSRGVLSRLSLQRARALAAVTSDEIENISTVVAALSVREDLPTLLRAGSVDVMDETRALFSIGVVRDVYLIGGALLAAAALGSEATEAFACDDEIYVTRLDGTVESFAAHVRAIRVS
ncbi:MAG TPA: NAD-binding protein [Solirubrobacteraceae bacterium]|nr:NAD-binding protein [Solirubrobacteraceae bacterium]